MTRDHLRPLLDSNSDMLFVGGEMFSRGQIPHDIEQLVKLGGGARHCGKRGNQAKSCQNHRSTVEFSSSRGHSTVPTRIDHARRV